MNGGIPTVYDPQPADVASWLSAHNWQLQTKSPGRAALWTLGAMELVQPTLRNASDYDLRMEDMLRRLAAWADRTPDAVAQEFVAEGCDVSEWRAMGAGLRDYSVPLEDGFALVQSVRNAFIAAANAAVHRRGYFGHSKLKVARDHARTVRMGQTRRGSYIVPIISRIPGAVEQSDDQQGRFDLDVSSQPYERRVMAQLSLALSTIAELAVGSATEPTQRELNESVASGVSHELCAAVAGALEAKSFGDVEVSFAWARRVPKHPGVTGVALPKLAGPIVSRMADRLRGSDIVGEQVLTGMVRSHRREPHEDDGVIYIRAPIGDSIRTVSMTVSATQLHEALMAADEKKPVFVRGRLIREQGRAWRFESVSDFGIAEAAPLSWWTSERG